VSSLQIRKIGAKRLKRALLFIVVISIWSLSAMIPARAFPSGTYFNNLVTIMMENQSLCSVYTGCGGTGTYESQLADANVLVNSWGTIGHNSEPNYIALAGAFDDSRTNNDGVCCYFESQPNIIDRIEGAGLTWTAWAEDASNSGTCNFSPPRHGDHFPFIDFVDMNTTT
jgi:hypothetical protein